jgi:type IV secretion system protein VirB6
MPLCPADPALGLIARLFDVVDCHIRVLVHDSYRDLVGPGTMFANVLTVLLTIYIAIIGYQLMIGRGGVRLSQMPVEALKVGLILAFTTSWAAYQTVVYDLFFDGPREILSVLLRASGAGGVGDLYADLQSLYERLAQAASVFGGMASPSANILQGGPMLGSGLLWIAAIAILLVTVGLILASKIVLGFLLALGPIFVGLFLFETTRGFFDGWLRAVTTFALTPLAASAFGAALTLMLEPFAAAAADLAAQRRFDMGTVITIVLITSVFVIVMLQVVRISTTIGGGYQSIRARRDGPVERVEAAPAATLRVPRTEAPAPATAPATALTLERSISTADRRAFVVDATPADAAPRLEQSYRRLPRPTHRRGDRP